MSGKKYQEQPGDSHQVIEEKRAQRQKRVKEMEHDTRPCKKKCIVWFSIIFAICIIGLGIAWTISMFKAIEGLKRSSCSIFHTFENIKEGVNDSKIEFKFAGLSGMKFLMGKIKSSIDMIDSTKLDNIVNQNLEAKGNSAYASLKTFYDIHKNDVVLGCNGTPVKPDHINFMTSEINIAVGTEFKAMQSNGKSLHKAA